MLLVADQQQAPTPGSMQSSAATATSAAAAGGGGDGVPAAAQLLVGREGRSIGSLYPAGRPKIATGDKRQLTIDSYAKYPSKKPAAPVTAFGNRRSSSAPFTVREVPKSAYDHFWNRQHPLVSIFYGIIGAYRGLSFFIGCLQMQMHERQICESIGIVAVDAYFGHNTEHMLLLAHSL